MTFDKNHTIQFCKTAIQKFTSVPKKFPLNLLLSVSNFASVGGCFIEMNGSVGGSVEMKFTSIGGGSKFKVPSSPRTYVLLYWNSPKCKRDFFYSPRKTKF